MPQFPTQQPTLRQVQRWVLHVPILGFGIARNHQGAVLEGECQTAGNASLLLGKDEQGTVAQ
jgi:hypothetical protein